ncbi:hypothetical protein GW793_03675 [bacterium]|uniref:Uncharacterized protein n=2 Tax=Katanobacteria TaxID=422282 RepID=A0A2M7X1M6_UNCKA|nr:hypothetical protein [bacterium]PIP56417.1 MAG: hypothetical protein COX05_03080 [candidate division WWE3 bacterium CG22_combo_CG10-13_8_21_14_all_39_12]PJA39891.1 MAG: hypothetical protein CO179_04125 [candidate division WWE3 bacterium CG_4_9_14_3_um_filter_39_7]
MTTPTPILVTVWQSEYGKNLNRVEQSDGRPKELSVSKSHLTIDLWGDWIPEMDHFYFDGLLYRFSPNTNRLYIQDFKTQQERGLQTPWYGVQGFLMADNTVRRPFVVSHMPRWADKPVVFQIDWPK